MADVSNITGLEKPLVKLIETIGSGLGVVGNTLFKFDEKKIIRISNAEAEATKQQIIKQAEGQAQAMAVLDRATQRFQLEQFSKQINLENIVIKSQDLLKDKKVSDEPVAKDWAMRFIDTAQWVSEEQLQNLLATILAQEVQKPGQFSLRTLDIVRNLTKEELSVFKKTVPLSSEDGFIVFGGKSNEFLTRYGLSWGEILMLQDISILNPSVDTGFTYSFVTERETIVVGNKKIHLKSAVGTELHFLIYSFSRVGAELYQLMLSESKNDKQSAYIKDFKAYIKSAYPSTIVS